MKSFIVKYSLTGLFAIALFMSPLVVRAEAVVQQSPVSTQQVLESLQGWLTVDDNAGIKLVNASLKKSHEATAACDSRSFVQRMEFNYSQEEKGPSRDFSFIYSSLDDYNSACEYNWYFGESSDGFYPPIARSKYGIFNVPVRLRDLVPALLKDEKLMTLMGSLFGEKAHIKTQFVLAKNTQNQLEWNVVFKDVNTGLTYKIRTSGASLDGADFMVFRVK